jgi:hypothetical protein
MLRTANRRAARFLSGCMLAFASSITVGYAATCVVAPATAPTPLEESLRRTVVITDPKVLNDPAVDFSLGRTLGSIINTAPGMVDSQAERVALLASLVRSFRAAGHVNPDSQTTLPVPPRKAEAALDPIALLDPASKDGMRVVGLFNRYDLAPATFQTCGEHRIVYAKNSTGKTDRFFLIFEAALDNPRPELGAEGCRQIAEFWDGLKNKTGTALATDLAKFYYDGLAPGIEPVVHFSNYGLPFGQVRGNIFVESPWQLREWRVSLSADGAPVFAPVTVKTNPFPPLYSAPASNEDPKISALRQTFQTELVEQRVPEMATVDRGGIAGEPESQLDFLFAMGAAFPNQFNGFESTSQNSPQRPSHDPAAIATAELKAKITQRLNQLGIGSACQLTDEHMLNRAGALSCGGCHQLSNNKPVAPGVPWPPSLIFVHIDEQGQLSNALEQFFLPARQQNLARHVQTAPTPPPAPLAVAKPSPTDKTVAPAVRVLREAVAGIPKADSRLTAINSITEIEKQVQSLRARDQATPGAFVPYRRTH